MQNSNTQSSQSSPILTAEELISTIFSMKFNSLEQPIFSFSMAEIVVLISHADKCSISAANAMKSANKARDAINRLVGNKIGDMLIDTMNYGSAEGNERVIQKDPSPDIIQDSTSDSTDTNTSDSYPYYIILYSDVSAPEHKWIQGLGKHAGVDPTDLEAMKKFCNWLNEQAFNVREYEIVEVSLNKVK